MKLAELFGIYKQYFLGADPSRDVAQITTDHREVKAGSVFIAIRGTKINGHDYIQAAIQQGAIGLVVEDLKSVPKSYDGAYVGVPNTRHAVGDLASRFYADPSLQMFCVGVTGTNGKTSTTYLIESVLNEMGMPTGVIGTVNHHMHDVTWESSLTTPDPITLQKRLAEFVALGAKAVALEASSHALDQGRVDSIAFDVGVFTNLTRDHLDYHRSMEDYFGAKSKLFQNLLGKRKTSAYAIVNEQDPWAARLSVPANVKRWGYGEVQTDFQFQILKLDFSGTTFRLVCPRGEIELKIQLVGKHNVYNAVAAMAVGLAVGAPLDLVKVGVEKFSGVPGRLQRVGSTQPSVFVDYAHTDAALKTVLSTLDTIRKQSHLKSKIVTVFGCGGNRDQGKRPLMAQVATELSDIVIITSDNPRDEDPMSIIQSILQGVDAKQMNKNVFVEVDREQAIRKAIEMAGPKDVVLIAGKGHEDYQIIGDRKIKFSDIDVAKEYLGGV